ncbi:MAG: hypothetical protein IJP65_02990 [Bacteroidales bacterium]|nr:hypothetical protein [Bacteroidales bacterium]
MSNSNRIPFCFEFENAYLTSRFSGKIVSCTEGGKGALVANADKADVWETIVPEPQPDGTVAFRCKFSNLYISVVAGTDRLVPAVPWIDVWEKFRAFRCDSGDDSVFVLQSCKNDKFVRVYVNSDPAYLVADCGEPDSWEQFRFHPIHDGAKHVLAHGDVQLLVDCGGSGVKIRRIVQGALSSHTQRFRPISLEDFYTCLGDVAEVNNPSAHPHVAGIAISICGEYDYVNEEVLGCWAYPFLVGNLSDKLKVRFGCGNVRIVNDGDAHSLALKSYYRQKGLPSESAINLSLGTAVGFGILDWNGELLHTCRGHNWEVGCWQCETTASRKDQYWALGSQGLKALEEQYGSPNAYIYYGQRLCHFFGRDLVPIFHPKIIGLSGGIVAAHYKDIEAGIQRECEERRYRTSGGPLEGVDIYLSSEEDSVMRGLANLLDRDSHSGLSGIVNTTKVAVKHITGHLRKLVFKSEGVDNVPLRDRTDWEKAVPENRPCALFAVHAGQAICAEDGGNAQLVANREKALGSWETFIIIKNGDGSFSLKSAANDKYVSACPFPDSRIIALGPKVDAWEIFDLKEVSGKKGVFTLWSRNAQKFVSVDETQGNALVANRDVADEWEEFRIFCV